MRRFKKLLSKIWSLPKKVLIPAVIVLLVLGWFFFLKPSKTEEIKTALVKRENIQSTVSASGILTGRDSATLKFGSAGKLSYLTVREGDTVKKGQVIASLDTKDLSFSLQQAQNTLRARQAIVDKIHDDLKDHSGDETYTQRSTRTQAEVDADNAYEAVKAAQRAFQDAVITAPISGVVTQIGVISGQNVSPADIVAQIVDVSETYFNAEIDEADIGDISLGQKATVTLNAYPDRTFSGTVANILPQTKTSSTGATIVIVKINLGQPGIVLVNGLNGQVLIVKSEVMNALGIPQDALREDNTVIVKEGNNYISKKIETGLKSDLDVEVKSGLDENQEVVTTPESVKNIK
jgi:RND family efflux transporter MFP subunit